jgi:hypothetical protein
MYTHPFALQNAFKIYPYTSDYAPSTQFPASIGKNNYLLLLFWLSLVTVLHRVHTEWQRPIYSVHSIMSKNQSWLPGVGGVRPPPFTIFTITYKVAVYDPAERADHRGRYKPPISSVTLSVHCSVDYIPCTVYCVQLRP